MTNLAPVTRRVARAVLTTIKKIGNSRGITLKKIHEYIRDEYPNTPTNIVRLNNTLQKALSLGVVNKRKNRYVLGSAMKQIMDAKGQRRFYVIQGYGKVRGRKLRKRRKSRGTRRRVIRKRK